jgi:hypothetical protein
VRFERGQSIVPSPPFCIFPLSRSLALYQDGKAAATKASEAKKKESDKVKSYFLPNYTPNSKS